jgi:hypothetical protein
VRTYKTHFIKAGVIACLMSREYAVKVTERLEDATCGQCVRKMKQTRQPSTGVIG